MSAGLCAGETGMIPAEQIGAEVQKQCRGARVDITPMRDGAFLRSDFQKLGGAARNDGLWLTSMENDAGDRFRVLASAVGRQGQAPLSLPRCGSVQTTGDMVRYVRSQVVEEYSVSVDGVRQDFVVLERPTGQGPLGLHLEVSGAAAELAGDRVKLTLERSRRTLAYHRLQVTDATGRALSAHMEALAADRLSVVVDDTAATYPVRVDPTYSDEDWASLASTAEGSGVHAIAVDATGNIYVGGHFTSIDNVAVVNVAKWNGSEWAPLGSGVGDGYADSVSALAIIGGDLYVGGRFQTVGNGVAASNIARWNGSAWSPLGSGVDDSVLALSVIGTDLYAGGEFSEADGITVRHVAKWNGTAWSALGLGFGDGREVRALAVMGGELYAGGDFVTLADDEDDHEAVRVNGIARWDGSHWAPLGSGLDGQVHALAVKDGALYVGGSFSTAGGVSARNIAKWSGGVWSALGEGMSGGVLALVVSGSELFAGGDFPSIFGPWTDRLARWNGSLWAIPETQVDDSIVVMAADASGHLFVGGRFSSVGSVESPMIAQLNLASPRTHQILVEQPSGVELSHNESWVDFGEVAVTSARDLTFTIRNIGATLDLAIVDIDVSSGDPAGDFTITSMPAETIPPGGSTTLVVRFAPSSIGQQYGRVTVFSNDQREDRFSVDVIGYGVSPPAEIRVTDPAGKELVDGGSFDLGTLDTSPVSEGTLIIRNLGTVFDLTGLSLTIDGANAGDFAVVAEPVRPLAAGASTSLTIKFSPSALGLRSAVLHIASNDADESPFDIALSGINHHGLTLAAAVDEPSLIWISSGSFAPWKPQTLETHDGQDASRSGPIADGESSSMTTQVAGPGTLSFWWKVSSQPSRGLLTFWVNGAAQAGIGPLSGSVGWRRETVRIPAGVNTLEWEYAKSTYVIGGAAGEDAGWVDEVSFVADGPDIAVDDPSGTGLHDGVGSVAMGTAPVGASSGTKTFTVRNTGLMTLTSLAITQDWAPEFAVGPLGSTTVPPGGSTSFTVTFSPPHYTGLRSTVIHITSNDLDESPFDIQLSGVGISQMENWRQTYFGTTVATGDTADDADPDRDGQANLLEFFTGSHPLASNPMPVEVTRVGGMLEFTFTRRTAAVDYPYSYVVWSDTLLPGSWDETGVVQTVLSDNGTIQKVKATVPAAGAAQRFMRLIVSEGTLLFPR